MMIRLTPHQQRALNYKNHTSLTANAGSGKTFVLSKRYLEIALNEDISLRNIAAITFTDKAAGELYKKIAEQIEEKIAGAAEPALLKKLESLRRQLVSANISTIHSFCSDILKEYPVEAGIDANFIPIEEQRSNELIELSVEEMIKKSLHKKDDEQRLKYLIRTFSSKTLFASEIRTLIKNRKNVLNLYERLYKNSEEEIARFFYSKFIELAKYLLFGPSGRTKSELISALKKINDFVFSCNNDNAVALTVLNIILRLSTEDNFENLLKIFHELKDEICTQNLEIRKSYLKEGFERERELLENFFTELNYFSIEGNHHEIEIELARFGKELIYFYMKALEIYDAKKKENGWLDFEDILLKSFDLLKKENVREALSEKFKYIMIDEYQDTNEVQYEIFLPILNYLKKGNLFVVGDEKQSIYMFRDAELEVFFKTKKEIEEASGRENILSLPESFRMAPALCAFTNYVFRDLFSYKPPNSINLFNEVEYSELVCARPDDFEGKVEILIADKEADNSEAELVAKKILILMDENEKFNWSDIAVLCRKRKNFSVLEKKFTKYNIPFSVVGGKGFYQKQSIYDIYNYFSFLLSTGNDTALIGVLRSPFFSISDSEIYEISLEAGFSFWEKLKTYSKKNMNCRKAFNQISENLSLVNNYEIPSLLRKILEETDMFALLSAKPDGVQETANIQKLIKLTINFSSQPFNTLYDYINFLKESIEKIEDEAQAPLSDESNTGSVKIMTLHQAKGLEFPVVFLFKCDESSKPSGIKAKEIIIDKNLGLLTKVPVNESYFSEYQSAPIIGAENFIIFKKNLAELKRLLYVGITRAQNYLFISTEEKKTYPRDSFMGLLSQVFDLRRDAPGFQLNEKLKFLRNSNGKYFYHDENISLSIPIIPEIIEFALNEQEANKTGQNRKIRIEGIKDETENEIISATKISVYKQCPLKYQLTYEYGFNPLLNQFRSWFKESSGKKYFEFSDNEDRKDSIGEEDRSENLISADVKGRIIHKILQKELPPEKIYESVEAELKSEIENLGFNDCVLYPTEIVNDLQNFFSSGIYRSLKTKQNYKNEFEIYIKENDYFLYGIVDKIIFEENKIVVVDYKTDDISRDEITLRGKIYLSQLKFYLYIISKLFPDFHIFESILLFIKHPDKYISSELNRNDLNLFGIEIKKIVGNMRKNNFLKNEDHCKECYFAINNSCIKK